MNLTEATDLDVKRILSYYEQGYDDKEIFKKLKGRGFRSIGSGAFAEIWAKRGYKRLIKMRMRVRTRASSYRFYEFCKDNKNVSKYLPKVYYLTGGDSGFMAVVEKLEIIDWENIGKYIKSDEEIVTLFKIMRGGIRTFMEMKKRKLVPHYATFNTGFLDVLSTIDIPYEKSELNRLVTFLGKNFSPLDIYSNNIMARPRDNHLVLMDPVGG